MILAYIESTTSTTTVSSLLSSLEYRNEELETKLNENTNKSEISLKSLRLTDDDMRILARYLLFTNTVSLFIILKACTYIDSLRKRNRNKYILLRYYHSFQLLLAFLVVYLDPYDVIIS